MMHAALDRHAVKTRFGTTKQSSPEAEETRNSQHNHD
jgi:hypothetical protein